MPKDSVAAPALPDNPVLILGAPRSGTTWMAKIFDSHPTTLYRHEPDEIRPAPLHVVPADIEPLLRAWSNDRCLRTATKRPFFAKSWQSAPGRILRTTLAYAVNGAARLPAPFRAAAQWPVPDLGDISGARIVIKSVRWCDGIGCFAQTLPRSRSILILRHPCGQVDSVMRGTRQRRFELREVGTDMPFDEILAIRRAAFAGVDEPAFQALPDAAKYAWAWVAFNETALDGLAGLPNARSVLYEDLCRETVAQARELLDFAGLPWHPQTAGFIAASTSRGGPAGYYAVFRDSVAAAERWRATMSQADQAAVRDVVRHTALARFWPDLTAETA